MEALNRYRKCFFVYERNFLKWVGHDFFVDNFKPRLHAYVMYTIYMVFIFTNIYTMIYYDTFVLLNALMFMSLSTEVRVFVLFANQSEFSILDFSLLPHR